MLVIPAIDIRGGRCVRLVQGDPGRETVYSDDPVAMAKRFQDMGAQLIHVVDLDGAFEGRPVNHETVGKIAAAISIPVEIGGGVRTARAIEQYLDAGIDRVILGTVLLDPEFRGLLERFAGHIIAGIDARDSMVATHGWQSVTSVPAVECIKELQKMGVGEIIFTDISTDGMLTGPNFASIERILGDAPGVSLIASGGVSCVDDVVRLAAYEPRGLRGCITGKAVYDGRLDLAEAFRAVQKPKGA